LSSRLWTFDAEDREAELRWQGHHCITIGLRELLLDVHLDAGQPAFINTVPLLFKWKIKKVGRSCYLLGTRNCSGLLCTALVSSSNLLPILKNF
jgi:hypothetical protein